MYSVHAFAQHKLTYEALKELPAEQQVMLDRALTGSRWHKDSNGNYLSPPEALTIPKISEQQLVVDLPFHWSDAATRELACSAASPQLLVCEVLGVADRADMNVSLHGIVADVEGQPLPLFTPVPPPLQIEVRKQLQAALGQSTVHVFGYRSVGAGETVRSLEFQTLTRRRDKKVLKVKGADLYDIRLEHSGQTTQLIISRRATLRENGPAQPPQSILGSSTARDMVLHALNGVPIRPFALFEGQSPAAPSASAQAWLLKLTVAPEPPRPPASKPPRATKQGKAVPVPPKRVEPAHTGTTSQLEPQHQPEPALVSVPAPAPIAEPMVVPDPWLNLPEKIAVDEEVVQLARKTLERHRPLLLTGVPGVGKTLLATLLAEALCGPGNYTLVTADARWTSAEVLGGLRVVPGNTLRYEFSPGIVTRAATIHSQSLEKTGKPHALIIDEFNRAHQDEAFGRLLTLLDPQYRSQLPLVDSNDGAIQEVHLPQDFLLIGTMNDADTARLHDLSAALQRRFTSVEVTTPASEQAYLKRIYPELPAQLFDTLYAFVGHRNEENSLRGVVPLGTHFMTEVLEYVQSGMTLDAVLTALLKPRLAELTRHDLEKLANAANHHNLPILGQQLRDLAAKAVF